MNQKRKLFLLFSLARQAYVLGLNQTIIRLLFHIYWSQNKIGDDRRCSSQTKDSVTPARATKKETQRKLVTRKAWRSAAAARNASLSWLPPSFQLYHHACSLMKFPDPHALLWILREARTKLSPPGFSHQRDVMLHGLELIMSHECWNKIMLKTRTCQLAVLIKGIYYLWACSQSFVF